MTESPADTLRAAAKALLPSSPAVAALTVSVQIPPAAADAIADWLTAEMVHLESDNYPAIHAHALAVARAILGDPR